MTTKHKPSEAEQLIASIYLSKERYQQWLKDYDTMSQELANIVK